MASRSFLDDAFVAGYDRRPPPFGFPIGGGATLGELVFLLKYSRLLPDGGKERWVDCCRRVIEGTWSVLHDHCRTTGRRWDDATAKRIAEDAFERLFTLRWTPPGRGLWMMGTDHVAATGGAALNSCAFVSTSTMSAADPGRPFARLMAMSMLGIGVGLDTRGANRLTLHQPEGDPVVHVVEDTREGWCASVDAQLRSFLVPSQRPLTFHYGRLRPAGAPLKAFGGTSAGPAPLAALHTTLARLLGDRQGQRFGVVDVVDVANLIGKAVAAGGIRRTAELVVGDPGDATFRALKNPAAHPERMGPDGWGFVSNHSVAATVGADHGALVEPIARNGEPGLLYLDLARRHGRLADPADDADGGVLGTNPCGEVFLEDGELCTLVEVFPSRCTDLGDFRSTLGVAALYAKAVTLLPTPWAETEQVRQRNRRTGISVSGLATLADHHGPERLRRWLDAGYAEVAAADARNSEWLGVSRSIRTTSVKPSGSVSLLAGVTPGVHWPVAASYLRRIRFRLDDPLVAPLEAAGFPVEPDVMAPTTTVVATFPVAGPPVRSERSVALAEKLALAQLCQAHWADNAVSATFTFRADEQSRLGDAIAGAEGRLKAMSFLPLLPEGAPYAQMPYEPVAADTRARLAEGVSPLRLGSVYAAGAEAEGEAFCTTDACEIPVA